MELTQNQGHMLWQVTCDTHEDKALHSAWKQATFLQKAFKKKTKTFMEKESQGSTKTTKLCFQYEKTQIVFRGGEAVVTWEWRLYGNLVDSNISEEVKSGGGVRWKLLTGKQSPSLLISGLQENEISAARGSCERHKIKYNPHTRQQLTLKVLTSYVPTLRKWNTLPLLLFIRNRISNSFHGGRKKECSYVCAPRLWFQIRDLQGSFSAIFTGL